MLSDTVVYADARVIDIPRAKHRMRGKWVFPRAEMESAEDSAYIRPDCHQCMFGQ